MAEEQHIFLVGYMAAGKTTVGAQLARSLNRPFVDLDQQIEARAECAVSEIFARSGEPAFRKLENEVLVESTQGAPSVIATGGGTPAFAENMRLMKKAGVVVYLDVPLPELIDRLLVDRAQRPLLAELNDRQVVQFVSRHFESRSPAYEQADVVFSHTDSICSLCLKLADYTK